MDKEEKEPKVGYKIEANRNYIVYRTDYRDRTFYKIQVQKTDFYGNQVTAYKTVKFKKGVVLQDGAIIQVKSGFEDFYMASRDRYNPVWIVFITDFELVKTPDEKALDTFNEKEDIDLPF